MADTNTPTAPAAPVTPTPAPAPPSTPAARSITPPPVNKPKVTAKKALGLEASVSKLVGQEIKKARERFRGETKVTDMPSEPAPAKPKAAPVATPAPSPASEPAPASAPAPVAEPAPTPTAPAKIKIGDKEYSAEELEAKLREVEKPAAPASAPALEAPQQQQPAQPTAEEIAQREAAFVRDTAATLAAPLTEEQMDTILAGGKDAVDLLSNLRKQDMATAILNARKGIAQALDPVMQQMFAALKPLVENHQSLQRYNVEQQFMAKHKDFAPHMATARQVAEELVRLYPQAVQRMNTEQFIDEVARQTDILLANEHKRWFPNGNGNWRAQAAPAAAQPAPPAQPAAPVPASAPVPTPAPVPAPAQVAVRPPAANAPLGASAAGAPSWHKAVAHSLR